MFRRQGVMFLLVLSAGGVAWACGPYFPNAYLPYGNQAELLIMPEACFVNEVSVIVGGPKELPPAPAEDNSSSASDTAWQVTLMIDVADLRIALTTAGQAAGQADALANEYQRMREAIHAPFSARQQAIREQKKACYEKYLETGKEEPLPPPPPVEPVDTAPYEGLLGRLPAEFSAYARGTACFFNEDYDGAIQQWKTLLDLPREQRTHRSVWAAFMIGKACLKKNDPAQAVPWFEHTRQLVQEGLSDVAGLGPASVGWLGRANFAAKRYPDAIRVYVDFAKIDFQRGVDSLRRVCEEAAIADAIDPQLAQDPLCRKIITAWVIANPGRVQSSKKWQQTVLSVQEKPLEGADRLAWADYNRGDMEGAAHWVALAPENTPYARWVKSKLLLREGKVDEAVAALQDLCKAFPPEEQWWFGENVEIVPKREVSSELGTLLLARKDYMSALDVFAHNGHWMDTAYVAERVLTVQELADYISDHASDEDLKRSRKEYCDYSERPTIDRLRDLLARRLARQDGPAKAVDTYATDEIRQSAKTLADDLAAGKDTGQPARTQAEKLFEAGEIARNSGLEIQGTELDPDWALFEGQFELPPVVAVRTGQSEPSNTGARTFDGLPEEAMKVLVTPETLAFLKPSEDECARIQQSLPKPNKRFHYRYIASNLMMQCAKLLPDNDALTAKALFNGGDYVRERDPEFANQFYKALVSRCRGLTVGQEANELRWFPETCDTTPVEKQVTEPTKK